MFSTFFSDVEAMAMGHLLLSLVVAFIGTQLFKLRYTGESKKVFILLLGFCLIFPLIGYILVLSLSLICAYLKENSFLNTVSYFDKEAFYKNPFPKVKRIFGEGAITDIATNQTNHSQNKLKSVVFMAEHPSYHNISLIKGLLSDPDNEIRLYSFSLLSGLENELNEKINRLLSSYEEEQDSKKKAIFAKELASLYWEFIHFGLSDSESANFVLEKVESYAKLSLKEIKDPILFLLLAKVAFYKKEHKEAEKQFKEAANLGISNTTTAPYLAEISFYQKAYPEVKKYLSQITPSELTNTTEALYKQWVKAS